MRSVWYRPLDSTQCDLPCTRTLVKNLALGGIKAAITGECGVDLRLDFRTPHARYLAIRRGDVVPNRTRSHADLRPDLRPDIVPDSFRYRTRCHEPPPSEKWLQNRPKSKGIDFGNFG